jgi:hypothetical protein
MRHCRRRTRARILSDAAAWAQATVERSQPLAPFGAIGNNVDTWRGGAGRGFVRAGGFDMSTMSTDDRRQRRSRTVAAYGVAFVTIVLVLLLVQVVGHETGHLFAKVSRGLSY